MEEEPLSSFIRATGGGKGEYKEHSKGKGNNDETIFDQREPCGQGCGFGRLQFTATEDDFKPYLKIPKQSDPRMALCFMQNVWNLPSPKLLIGITGGATEFKRSPELEMALNELMQITRETDAWLVTGGTRGGIMKYFGQARYRFGGNIPLIGITTWGSVANREKLEVKPQSFNYGYITRKPVKYEDVDEDKLEKGTALLDQNHSHFLLVDDGTSQQFGGEISYRGEFEKCACTHYELNGADLMVELKMGWDGATYLPQHVRKPPSEGGVHRLCLCFEGGEGTIGTVEASVRNGTPTLVIQDTGRAADLIADCVLAYSGEKSATVRPRSSVGDAEKKADSRRELIEDFERLMLQDARDREKLASGEPRPKMHDIIKLGAKLNNRYRIKDGMEPDKLLVLMDSLHAIASSGLCLSYRPGSVRMVGSEWVSIGVRESMSRCLLLGITKSVAPTSFASQQVDRAMKQQEKLQHENLMVREVEPPKKTHSIRFSKVQAAIYRELASIASRDAGEAAGEETEEQTARKQAEVERQKLSFAKLQMLTEWGQVGMLEAHLHERQEANGNGMVSTDELGQLLHLALLQNQPDIATLAFARGASVMAYEDPVRYEREACGEDKAWVELLVGASDEQEERYMLNLILEAQYALGSGCEKDARKIKMLGGAPAAKMGATEIKGNEEAIKILNNIIAMVVLNGVRVDEKSSLIFNFTYEPLANGENKSRWAGANLNLFLFLILVNRTELAYMFFAREAQRNAASALANALWACLLCRRLSQLPEVGQFAYHLKNGFETTAAKYEDIATSILTLAHRKSDRFTLQALKRPLKQCPQWTLLDLMARGRCRNVISVCPELCIAAIQNRFYGEGSLVAAMERMNTGARKVLTSWCKWEALIAKLDLVLTGRWKSLTSNLDLLQTQKPNSKSVSRKESKQESEAPGQLREKREAQSQTWATLFLCVAIDSVRVTYYVYPLFPWFFFAYIWAPVMSILNHYLHRNICLSIFAFIEELLPILDLFPSATIGYLLQRERLKEAKAIAEAEHLEDDLKGNEIVRRAIKQGFVPIDHFILDFLTYCVLAHLLTLVVLMTPSFSTFCMELVVLLLMLIDAIPDIVFEGMEYIREGADGSSPEKTSLSMRTMSKRTIMQNDSPLRRGMRLKLTEVLDKGFKKYIQNSSERLELLSSISFITGFVLRYAGMLLWLLSLAGSTHGSDQWCSVLYGVAVGTMWFRILGFFLVQQDLGKFVRVMLNMTKDLGFFSIVWGVLVMAFSTALLGALDTSPGDQDPNAAGEDQWCGEGKQALPMQSWAIWWFIRTYLQSLGQDNLDEMTTGPSNVFFLLMWPIFNVLLVNLLVAVMGDRYDEAKDQSQIAFCLELYDMDKEIRHRGHTNVIVFLGAAFQAFVSEPSISKNEITAEDGQEVANKGLLQGKVDRILKKRNMEEWWVAYAERIQKNVMQNRVASRSGILEEQDAIDLMLEKVDGKDVSDTDYKEVVILRKAVRLAVERNQEERLNDKKVTDHLVRITMEVLDSLTAKDIMQMPAEDPTATGAEYCSTKGQASKNVGVVLASHRFMMAGSQRTLRTLRVRSNSAGEGESAEQEEGPAGTESQPMQHI